LAQAILAQVWLYRSRPLEAVGRLREWRHHNRTCRGVSVHGGTGGGGRDIGVCLRPRGFTTGGFIFAAMGREKDKKVKKGNNNKKGKKEKDSKKASKKKDRDRGRRRKEYSDYSDYDDEYSYYSDYSDYSRSQSRRGRDRDRKGKDKGRDRGRDRDRDCDRRRDKRSRSRSRRGGGRSPARDARPPQRNDRPMQQLGNKGSGDHKVDVQEFIERNQLDDRVVDAIHALDEASQMKLMGTDGGQNTFDLLGKVNNPNAVVMSRIRKM